MKKIANKILLSLSFRILAILLIFVDLGLMATDIIVTTSKLHIPLEYRTLSLVIAIFFLLDVVLQVFLKGKKHYFSDFLNITDAAITIIILFMDITYIFFNATFFKDIQRMIVFFRLLRLITLMRIFHLATQKRHLEKLIRRLEVARFFNTRHPEHYFVYNLCSERSYDPKYFHHHVHRIMIEDHNVPTLEEMVSFAKEVIAWLSKDPHNIIIIHCKGGKGRTGTMISILLLATGTFLTAKSRYVHYFDILKNVLNWEMPVKKPLKIVKFVIYSIQGVGEGNGADLKIEIIMQHKTVFTCTRQTCTVVHDIDTNRAIFLVPNCPDLCDDVKVKFSSSKLPNYYDDCAFFMWFHTSLIEKNRLYLTRADLDNPHKEKTWNIYRPDFAVDIFFEEVFQ
ncbi:phosphatidylinositol 3,4,5-trisphosphate 3-phosphatase TPTE2-like [Thomomys bottae]